jgi:hypothetical protein
MCGVSFAAERQNYYISGSKTTVRWFFGYFFGSKKVALRFVQKKEY